MADSMTQLLGIGLAVPKHSMSQQGAAQTASALNFNKNKSDRLKSIFAKTFIQQRGSVIVEGGTLDVPKQSFFHAAVSQHDRGPGTRERLERYEQEAGPLAIHAAREALDDAKTSSKQITHLITVTCTGFSAPGFDWSVIQDLNLDPQTQRIQIGFMGCHAMVNAMRTAKALAHESKKNHILIVSVELPSLHYSYQMRADHMISNALFADGAAACVMSQGRREEAWSLAETGSCLFPNTKNLMSWKIGNHGFEMVLSSKVPEQIEHHLQPWLASWLQRNDFSIKDIASWAIHPGGPKILSSVGQALDLADNALEVSRKILSHHGNLSSATLLFILRQLIRQKSPRPVVALAFGPGLTAEVALFL